MRRCTILRVGAASVLLLCVVSLQSHAATWPADFPPRTQTGTTPSGVTVSVTVTCNSETTDCKVKITVSGSSGGTPCPEPITHNKKSRDNVHGGTGKGSGKVKTENNSDTSNPCKGQIYIAWPLECTLFDFIFDGCDLIIQFEKPNGDDELAS